MKKSIIGTGCFIAAITVALAQTGGVGTSGGGNSAGTIRSSSGTGAESPGTKPDASGTSSAGAEEKSSGATKDDVSGSQLNEPAGAERGTNLLGTNSVSTNYGNNTNLIQEPSGAQPGITNSLGTNAPNTLSTNQIGNP